MCAFLIVLLRIAGFAFTFCRQHSASRRYVLSARAAQRGVESATAQLFAESLRVIVRRAFELSALVGVEWDYVYPAIKPFQQRGGVGRVLCGVVFAFQQYVFE